ncbi:MAG: tyrosine-type recombinase/integrase [Phycisphaerae bacterium]|nr:tyrosine-type recombinase/integrase [Phycisphaerae bacterium]
MGESSAFRLRLWSARQDSCGLSDILGRYLIDCRLAAGNGWARRCTARARDFLTAIGQDPAGITRPAIRAYLAALRQRPASPRTVRNHLAAIRGFCRFLREADILPGDPAEGIRGPAPEECLPRYVLDEELPGLLTLAARYDLEVEVVVALNTGLRMNELRLLRWEDVDFARRVLTVRKSKSKRPRLLPLNRLALEALHRQLQATAGLAWVFPGWRGPGPALADRPRGYSWWARALVPIAACHPAFARVPKGQTGRGWHLLRHTFATRLVRPGPDGARGVELAEVGDWMGHKSINTTKMYAHYAEGYDPRIERLAIASESAGSPPLPPELP